MKRLLSLIAILLQFSAYSSGQTHSVSGYVSDKVTRETLIGVTVVVKETQQGVATDKNGFFNITGIKAGNYILQFSYLGYQKGERIVHVVDKSVLLSETQLTANPVDLKEVSVVAIRPDSIGDLRFETSQLKMSPVMIKNIPAARNDIFRAIKYLPGIEATDPYSPLYSVRGGDPSGNMILLDGVTIYNPYHCISADGIFNIQSVKDIDIFTGGFGAEYGGRSSSIMYITTKDGNTDRLHGELEPTTDHAKLFLEFPVGKDGSMTIAGRYFYDLMSHFLLGATNYFYDVNMSYTKRINERNRLTIKLFNSHDYLSMNYDRLFYYLDKSLNVDYYDNLHAGIYNNWSNNIATAYLKTIVSPNIYLKTQIYGSFNNAKVASKMDFYYNDPSLATPIQYSYSSKFISKINDVCAKTSATIKTDAANDFHIGLELNSYSFSNQSQLQQISSELSIRCPSLLACYVEDKIQVGNFAIRPGLRASHYSYANKWEYEPRLNMTLDLPASLKFKAAWGIYYQYIISMNTQEYELSQLLDYYYPLKYNTPTKSVHYILELEKSLGNQSMLTVTAYYIGMPLTYMFNLNIDQVQAFSFSDKLEKGHGKSYGVELMWKGQYKKLSGWISYGLSRSTRSYPFLMDGKSFLYDYDRTHSLKTVFSYQISKDITYNTSLILQSGRPITLETTMQSYYYYNPTTGAVSFYPFGVEKTRNNARLPMSADLDFGVIKRIRSGFGADLAEFLKADASYFTVSITNSLFWLHRNVINYFSYGGSKYFPLGNNYLPSVSVGYVIKF